MNILAWHGLPDVHVLAAAIRRHATPLHLVICNDDTVLPAFRLPENPSALERELAQRLQSATTCLHYHGANYLQHLLPNVHGWWMNGHAARHLHEHFSNIQWQTKPLPQHSVGAVKPWFTPPPPQNANRVLVIGAGIAGAATARAVAEHGLPVTVLEAEETAHAASGNRQGLLYAKISPHATEQTELLLCGYGHTRRLLERLLPQQHAWSPCGVLHLNHDAAESKRNHALAKHHHHRHLYHAVNAAEASHLAGTAITESGLYWPQGAWLHPPALVTALLNHPLITLHTRTPLQHAKHDGQQWRAHTPAGCFSGSHIVFCSGDGSRHIAQLQGLPFQSIRGQTSIAAASTYSQTLRCALSGSSYLAPAWQGQHGYGATFSPHDNSNDWREADELANRQALAHLHAELAASLNQTASGTPGHAAVRCDAPDHLPLVGELGQHTAIQTVYAKLALDKNYRIQTPCPYWPNAYLNTAHGSRGLSTAPLCAASIAARITGTPDPLSQRLRQALHPNRTIIRALIRSKAD